MLGWIQAAMQQNTIEKALNAAKYLGWLKKFGLAQNILGPVKGQGIRLRLT